MAQSFFPSIDVHCHVTDTKATLDEIRGLATTQLALMGTDPDNWDQVIQCHEQNPERTLLGFGVHPWFAEKVAGAHPSWDRRLASLLDQYPQSFVGEFGMDRVATDPTTKRLYDWDTQLKVFTVQWTLAAERRRVVSIHAVQAQGWLLEFMRQQAKLPEDRWPLRIMFHSYTGSPDLLQQLLKLKGIGKRIYVSFSMLVNQRSPKFQARVQAAPDHRILIESDVHCATLVDSAMREILESVCSIKGWELEQGRDILYRNSIEFFGISTPQAV